jgi:hypothetical protein
MKLNTMRLFCVTALVLITGALTIIPPVHAAGSQLDKLQNEVNALKRKIDRLDARLRALEDQGQAQRPMPAREISTTHRTGTAATETAAEAAPVNGPKPAALSLDKAWKSLSNGMSEAEVHKLLGEPTHRLYLAPNTVWYYTYRDKGNGSVTMSPDGRVIDWQHPPHIGGCW